jgi:uncharacterized protein YfeS
VKGVNSYHHKMKVFLFIVVFLIAGCKSRKHSAITSLDLSNQNLKTIPDSVFSCENLQYLNLGNSNFTLYPPLSVLAGEGKTGDSLNSIKTISNDIRRLKHLKVLSFCFNDLQSLPSGIAELNQLDTLDLSFNMHLDIANELKILGKMKWLKFLNIVLTKTDSATLVNLHKAIPKTKIYAKPEEMIVDTLMPMTDYLPDIEHAHPLAKQLMNEEFYWSTIEETAPFGNDDGADTYAGFAKWRHTHKANDPKEFLVEQIESWGYPTFDLYETNFEKLKPYLRQSDLGTRFMSGIDAAITAIAFGQLYLEGTIDKDFNELAKIAIRRQLVPEWLNLWGETYKPVREMQLKKMATVLSQVN